MQQVRPKLLTRRLPATIRSILQRHELERTVIASGWTRSLRKQKHYSFLELNDGSCSENLQVVLNTKDIEDSGIIAGTSLSVEGMLVESPKAGQPFELLASSLRVLGDCHSDYPIHKKDHSVEFLRSVPHLRTRTALHSALMRLRHESSHIFHSILHEDEFVEIHAPVITFSDCEGAGEMFSLSGSKEFFGAEAHLTVSAQLHAEIAAASMPRVYTFGPTFRAEKHNTVRHMSEFWMLEPEISFIDNLDALMNFIESLLSRVSASLLESSSNDLAVIHNKQEVSPDVLMKRIDDLTKPYERITYDNAIKVLSKHSHEFKQTPKWGAPLQLEHEKFLAEKIVAKPCFVTDYPATIKSFYMRRNPDEKTVACCDLLVPGLAEIAGGSLREDRSDVLQERIKEFGWNQEAYQWYLDLRKFGGVPHGGFGLGFDRFLQYITGIHNIRDVCMIPRTRDNHKY